MSDQGEAYRRVSVPEAAVILGASVTTIRRRIRHDSLQVDRLQRGQGITYVVLLPYDHPIDTVARPDEANTGSFAETAVDEIVPLSEVTIGTARDPLVAHLDAYRQTMQRQADEIISQAETIGRLTADLRASQATLEAQRAPPTVEASTHESAGGLLAFLMRWWPLAGMLVVTLVMAAVWLLMC
jgi:hypothetical protein